MLRALYAVVFLLFLTQTANAQYQVRWVKMISLAPGSSLTKGEDLIVSPQGRVCINGIVDTPGLLNAVIINYDTSGTEKWRKQFGGVVTAEAWRLFLTPSNQWVTAGFYEDESGTNDIFYISYSQNGDSLSSGEQATPGLASSDNFSDAAIDSKGNVYLGGTGKYPYAQATLTRINTGGLFRWTSVVPYFTGTTNKVIGIAMAGDARIISAVANSTGYSTIACHDSSGTLLWRRDSLLYATEVHTAFTTDATGNAIAGSRFTGGYRVVKLNKNTGDTLWTRNLAHPGVSGQFGTIRHVVTDAANNIYVYGSANTHTLVAKLSPAGAVLWTDTIGKTTGAIHARNAEFVHLQGNLLTIAVPGFNGRLYQYNLAGTKLMDTAFSLPGLFYPEISAMQYFNGDLYITGSSSLTSGGGGSSRRGYTARLGMPAGVVVGVDEVALEKPPILYPNPAEDLLFLPDYAGNIVTVLDMTGRVCLQQKIIRGAVDISSLPAGAYIVMPDAHNRWASGVRFIKR